jgi:hypothetical protein
MKIYHGERRVDGICFVCVSEETQCGSNEVTSRELPMRLDLRDHGPIGFEWGCTGGRPAQLALALLADVLGDDQMALDYYQQFNGSCARPWSHVDADHRADLWIGR